MSRIQKVAKKGDLRKRSRIRVRDPLADLTGGCPFDEEVYESGED